MSKTIEKENRLQDFDLKGSITEALFAIWPICLGYIPLGLAMGVLGQKAGLYPFQVTFMSLCVFAGSGQFIAVSMISAGASIPSIIITTFMVNLRHLLMSSSLAVHFNGECRKKITLLSYGIVDETFAVNINKLKSKEWNIISAIVVNFTAFSAWVISTTTGCYFGKFIPENGFGLDYALTAMFITLLIFQLNGRRFYQTAIISGVTAVITASLLPGNSYIIIASITAATIGVFLKKRNKSHGK